MMTLAAVLAEVGGLDEAELVGWVERRWVRAERTDEGYRFRAVDVARVHLIREIRHDFAVDEDTMALVLSLLDQVYRLRRQVRSLADAIADQPEPVRDGILAALRARG